ncbi:hypothetical protein [Shigella dysenteriae]|uniref:hypothetical protein n=1 Tax=Shigella dysenteriae TaxID=622 RepID=UPI00148FB9FF|nr:hypothetical protein [Shigella dysenteriae]
MNVNAGHERTSKARIIHQIQLIRGITNWRLRWLHIRTRETYGTRRLQTELADNGIIVG